MQKQGHSQKLSYLTFITSENSSPQHPRKMPPHECPGARLKPSGKHGAGCQSHLCLLTPRENPNTGRNTLILQAHPCLDDSGKSHTASYWAAPKSSLLTSLSSLLHPHPHMTRAGRGNNKWVMIAHFAQENTLSHLWTAGPREENRCQIWLRLRESVINLSH